LSISISNLEDKENLIKDRLELQEFLKDVKLLLHINKYTDINNYVGEYILNHKDISTEELESRLDELINIFYMIKNND